MKHPTGFSQDSVAALFDDLRAENRVNSAFMLANAMMTHSGTPLHVSIIIADADKKVRFERHGWAGAVEKLDDPLGVVYGRHKAAELLYSIQQVEGIQSTPFDHEHTAGYKGGVAVWMEDVERYYIVACSQWSQNADAMVATVLLHHMIYGSVLHHVGIQLDTEERFYAEIAGLESRRISLYDFSKKSHKRWFGWTSHPQLYPEGVYYLECSLWPKDPGVHWDLWVDDLGTILQMLEEVQGTGSGYEGIAKLDQDALGDPEAYFGLIDNGIEKSFMFRTAWWNIFEDQISKKQS